MHRASVGGPVSKPSHVLVILVVRHRHQQVIDRQAEPVGFREHLGGSCERCGRPHLELAGKAACTSPDTASVASPRPPNSGLKT